MVPYITNDWIFKSQYCREKINSGPGHDENIHDMRDLMPNDERLRFLYDPSYMYNISQTSYKKEDLKTL